MLASAAYGEQPEAKLKRKIRWPVVESPEDEAKEREVAKWENILNMAGPENNGLARKFLNELDEAERRATIFATFHRSAISTLKGHAGVICLWMSGPRHWRGNLAP